MGKFSNRLKGAAAFFLAAVTILTAIPHPALAATRNPSYCDPKIDRLTNSNIGTEVPVILVHGFTGNTWDWGSLDNAYSFAAGVNSIPGVAVGSIFSYKSYKWVDSASNGPKLASTVDCLSQLSLHNGGKGKVVIVGYSMGGLMARQALSYTVSGRQIADEVGQVVTIGAPNTGTNNDGFVGTAAQASWFRQGSPELARLPHFPAQTIVHSIAGDVTRVYYDFFSNEARREHPNDDTLVPIASALDEYTNNTSIGGGKTVISCEKRYSVYTNNSVENAPCEHGQLTRPNNGVRADTIEAIKRYVAYLSTPPPTPTGTTLTVGTLTSTYDDRWINADYGASGPGEDSNADDTTNTTDCTNCSTTPPPQIKAFVQVVNMGWCGGPVESCAVDTSWANIISEAPAVTIGGRTPSFSARFDEGGPTGTGLVWCFETERICVYYRRGTTAPLLQPSQALLDLFATSTWTN